MRRTLLLFAVAVGLFCPAACAYGPHYNDHYYGRPGYYDYGPHGCGVHGSPYIYRYCERGEAAEASDMKNAKG